MMHLALKKDLAAEALDDHVQVWQLHSVDKLEDLDINSGICWWKRFQISRVKPGVNYTTKCYAIWALMYLNGPEITIIKKHQV